MGEIVLEGFHPITGRWFEQRFREPTEPQRLGWPEILAGRHTLVAAPTGSGKTLAAFLACIDRLLRHGLDGTLGNATEVVYVSPLKALSNDVRRNLEVPLAEIGQVAAASGLEPPPIRVLVRTGDTPARERQAMLRRPPHILVTTPESLYLLLTAAKSREMLRSVRTVVVDEIHALARDKRGSHLSLSLERLEALCERPPVRIGLSATVRPVDEIARFLVGRRRVAESGEPDCSIIDVGHVRELDLAVEVPPSELAAVCSNEQWDEIYRRLVELIQSHRSTLIFVNTRRLAERMCHNLTQWLGEGAVASHHGSLSRAIRLSAEERLKAGQLKAIVATASLELGIDIGFIDLVCQIGSPRSIATFLQRVGRSGHSLGVVPKGRLFALTRDELIESLALIRGVRQRRLDAVEIPRGPLDILAQQIVAAVACEQWQEDALFELCRRAWPYRDLGRADFDAIVEMLSEGVAPHMRRGAYLHRDRIGRRLRARRGARIAAITSGGAIPETADYRVVTEADRTYVGSVNEDFAVETMAGDVFLLGNTSWRVRHVRGGEVVVNDAQGSPATIPFWLGEAPGRTVELSEEVSALREEIGRQVGMAADGDAPESLHAVVNWLCEECRASPWTARQAAQYVAAQVAAIGLVPTQKQVLFERFFDESGGMQLVIHSPYGARINRAWGLALRKRFCRSFDFELQASADDNGIVLSLGPQHSFPIEQMFAMRTPRNAEHLLVQALLAVPMFQTRWRWNVTRALAVLRQRGGKKVPPPLQRFRADDLLSAVFPAQTACQENQTGDIAIPEHPLVQQTVYDCLHEAMDLDRWLELLARIERGDVQLVARDTREPSPFSHQILNANPYAFLDDAPLEERRARAVAARRTLTVESVRDLGWLDPEAIAQVRAEAWPLVRDADELHDTLLVLGALPAGEGAAWTTWFCELVASGRATELRRGDGPPLWVATERSPLVHAAFPNAVACPAVSPPESARGEHGASEAWVALVRGRLECLGPVTAWRIVSDLGLPLSCVEAALEALEGQGFVLRGRFTPSSAVSTEYSVLSTARAPGWSGYSSDEVEWCERRLLARIHRLTLDGLRRQIQPVEPADFVRFLIEHQHLDPTSPLDGRSGLVEVIGQLQGFELPAGAWEHEVLPARLPTYDPVWLDELSLVGHVAWGRLRIPDRGGDELSTGALSRIVPIALAARADLPWLLPVDRHCPDLSLRSNAQIVFDALAARGALFVHDLRAASGLLPAQLDDAISELAALGLVTSDGFAPIRVLISPDVRRRKAIRRHSRRGRTIARSHTAGGRWSLLASLTGEAIPPDRLDRWAWQLLRRYGVVFRDLLARETVAPSWALVLPVYRRLEARGEIRGGRFVSGVGGEQFATPAAVERLRRTRETDEPNAGDWLVISAADPANLFGIVTPGPRVPATRSNRLLVRGGQLVASLEAGEVKFHVAVDPALTDPMSRALKLGTRHARPGQHAATAAWTG